MVKQGNFLRAAYMKAGSFLKSKSDQTRASNALIKANHCTARNHNWENVVVENAKSMITNVSNP